MFEGFVLVGVFVLSGKSNYQSAPVKLQEYSGRIYMPTWMEYISQGPTPR